MQRYDAGSETDIPGGPGVSGGASASELASADDDVAGDGAGGDDDGDKDVADLQANLASLLMEL